MRTVTNIIIGAGPSGLSLAYHLQGDTLILEKEDRIGGLCRSYRYENGFFDIGGHSFHSPFVEVNELVAKLMPGRLYRQKRDARIFFSGKLIPYPFQQFYEQTQDSVLVEECRRGLEHRRNLSEATNLKEFIQYKFGDGIADHFMLPYNHKLWARDLKRISVEWTSERIASMKQENRDFAGQERLRKPLEASSEVAYPTGGGFEEIYKSFLPYIPALILNTEVVRIFPETKVIETGNGERYHYRRLISTMPLPVLLWLIAGAPPELVELSNRLEYFSLYVVFLLVGRRLPGTPQRVYIADPSVPPHKIVFNHNSSGYLQSLPQHAVMAEVSYSEYKPLEKEDILPRTINCLIEMGFLRNRNDVVWSHYTDVKIAYPVPTHDRRFIVNKIKSYLAELDIYTIGRFGEWDYINSDECIRRGMELASDLKKVDNVDG
jgi:protoporphyrinogen oxidase